MAITYPYNPPTSPSLVNVDYSPVSVTGITGNNTVALTQQVQSHQGERLDFQGTLPPMTRDVAESWIAWRLALRGRFGYFTMAVDPTAITARGAVTGSPTADSTPATQNLARSRELFIENLPLTTTDVFKAGDWISVPIASLPRLHKILQNVSSDSAGKAMLDIWPALRGDIPNATAITYASPKGTFRLTDNVGGWSVEDAVTYGLSFSAMERLP